MRRGAPLPPVTVDDVADAAMRHSAPVDMDAGIRQALNSMGLYVIESHRFGGDFVAPGTLGDVMAKMVRPVQSPSLAPLAQVLRAMLPPRLNG